MALSRLVLKNLQTKISTTTFTVSRPATVAARIFKDDQSPYVLSKGYATNAASQVANERSKELEADENGKKSVSKRPRRKSWRPWNSLFQPRRDHLEIFPSGLGNALLNASQNMNKLLEGLSVPVRGLPTWKLTEKDQAYKLWFQVPGLTKEDVKITVEDGVLHVTGEHKEEEEEGEEDEFWSAKMYGFYDTSLMLPEDAKVDEIQAELKNGVLNVVIPRVPEKIKKENVKEIEVAG